MYNSSAYVFKDKQTNLMVCTDHDMLLSGCGPTLEETLDSFEGILTAYINEVADHGGNPNELFISTKEDYQPSINNLEHRASKYTPNIKLKLHSKKIIPLSESNQYGLDQELSLNFI